MADLVDKLKKALNVSTDVALARELGIDRSTVAQWRRRKSLPAMYQDILHAEEVGNARYEALATRRFVYGDGKGMFLIRASMAVTPIRELDFPELSPALLGDHRERLLINVARFAALVCTELFGRPRCESEEEYNLVVEKMLSEESAYGLKRALMEPSLGEHI